MKELKMEKEVQQEAEDTEERPPGPKAAYRCGISAWGFSMQGESHRKTDTPCQDRSDFRMIGKTPLVLAAVADGVGSCILSDFGADRAVHSALDYMQEQLEETMQDDPQFRLNDTYMGKLLREAMQCAYDRVEQLAEEMEQLLYFFQSTLTVAVYDGENLYFGHAGDDGIVALTGDGIYALATARHSGEEAGSVYPLQSRSTWQFGKVNHAAAFIMATDGVLDAFVRGENEECRVYFPFIEPICFGGCDSREAAEEQCRDWYTYMGSESFRRAVTDDISILAVTNQEAARQMERPSFDLEEWERKTEAYRAKRKAALQRHAEEEAWKNPLEERQNPETEERPVSENGKKWYSMEKSRKQIKYRYGMLKELRLPGKKIRGKYAGTAVLSGKIGRTRPEDL